MSGRGRGRGRGRGAPPSGAKLLLMRSAQESGLDDKNLKSLSEITKPPLFPDMVWNYEGGGGAGDSTVANSGAAAAASSSSAKSRQSSTVYLINKGREIDHRIQTSAHWVRPSQTQVDVVRYQSEKKSHRVAQMPSDLAILEQMGKNLAMDEAYVPTELIPSNVATSLGKKRSLIDSSDADDNGTAKKKPALEELEKRESQRLLEESKKQNVLDEEGGFSDAVVEDEEEEEVEDYTTNYYASDDESGGGDDEAEATF